MAGQLADRDKVEYTNTVGKDEEERKRLTCKVRVGERDIVEVGDGLTRMEVETRAADEACKILRREGRRLGKGKGKGWRGNLETKDEGGEEEEEDDGDEEDGGVDVSGHLVREESGETGMKGKKRMMEEECEHDRDAINDDENDSDDDDDSDEHFMSAEE